MTSFLTLACCNGRRPRRWMGATIRSRPDLVSRLMRERQVARFLVAPPGYGKTFLALEYAQVIFGFNQVAWIDARSPCFLRDLDKGTFASDLMKRDPAMRLVVFDDVPRLGSQRADLLSKAIDELLEAGSEVMVLCHPSSDAFAGRQIDRICLTAHDLMLDTNERDNGSEEGSAWAGAQGDDASVWPESSVAAAIPHLAWGPRDAAITFAEGIAREELPDEVLAVHFALMVLGSASISWVCNRFGLSSAQVTPFERDYPHLGIDTDNDAFASVVLDLDCLARAYSTRCERIARTLSFEAIDALGVALADALMDGGDAARACAVAAALVGKEARIEWLADNGRRLSRMLCLLPAWRLGSTFGKLRADARGSRIEMQQAWRLNYLGDVRSALLAASRVAARANAPLDARVNALVLIALFGNEALRGGAIERLSVLVDGSRRSKGEDLASVVEPEAALARALVLRHGAELAVEGGDLPREEASEALLRQWRDIASSCSDGDAALLSAAIVFDWCPGLADDEAFLRLLENGDDDYPVAMLRLEAYRILGDLVKREEPASDAASRVFEGAVVEQSRLAERELVTQQQEYGLVARSMEKRQARRSPYARPTEDPTPAEGHVPRLQISLFGGIEVLLDGRRLEADQFTQTKMRALLAVLTMANGREVSRDRLLETLWPSSSQRTAQKNLYTNWAALKRTLSLPDGTCPFLHHVQGSYRIDGRLVTSDVHQVTAVCRALALEKPDPDRFRTLLDDLNRLYRGDLLPSEAKCDAIIEARDDYRSQVSDALVQASFRLLDMGEDQMALWFARSALEHERRQEDPYYALMSAQIACGQREAALETYRLCCRALMRAFSIDPSQRMINLYRHIMETEESF